MEQKNHKNIWRPLNIIRAKVIGIAQFENKILVCEVLDDEGVLKGWCPLGGGIEFGETSEEALKREMFEEAGCQVLISGEPMICDNIFEHHGVKGHELIVAFHITFSDPQMYQKKRFQIQEDKGSWHWVEWMDMATFQGGKAVFFPPALAKQLFAFNDKKPAHKSIQ